MELDTTAIAHRMFELICEAHGELINPAELLFKAACDVHGIDNVNAESFLEAMAWFDRG